MLDYAKALNPAQLEAVTCERNSVLVVAGAGSGKTRAIVYRLAWLVEQGVSPHSILLLTFTRKAAREMQERAANLSGFGLDGMAGGTFHSFAYNILRQPQWSPGGKFTLMDPADVLQALRECKDSLKIGKNDTSFPRVQTLAGIISKARTKELPISEILRRESFHLLPYAEPIEELAQAYEKYRREKALFDYDDLLFDLEKLLASNEDAALYLRSRYSHIMVDEYQDTNLVQARIVRQLAGPPGPELSAKVMVVGDEAQSIYAFRGANVRNILDFPKLFPDTHIIRLEENYRSTQPILNVANDILSHAAESFQKNLYTQKKGGEKPCQIVTMSDITEAQLVVQRIEDLLATHLPHEIAVLFRAGFHSYPLENALRQAGIAFRKYGGLRFTEAAHIKDILSFARLAINPLDLPAFSRIAAMHKGVGPKTVSRLYGFLSKNDVQSLYNACKRYPDLLADLNMLSTLTSLPPYEFFERLFDYYRPRLERLYPEDWPSRLQGLEEILHMAQSYEALDLFLADMALENPDDETESDAENCVTLSTIHSAKGLEWNAVLIIDMVEDRFPSRHAQARPEEFEEERRLFYVACTRARQSLDIYAPATVYSRSEHGNMPVARSPFLSELSPDSLTCYREKFGGLLKEEKAAPQLKPALQSQQGKTRPVVKNTGDSGYCRHRIFGRGKIIKKIDDNKMQVNFPGFGLKVILTEYLILED